VEVEVGGQAASLPSWVNPLLSRARCPPMEAAGASAASQVEPRSAATVEPVITVSLSKYLNNDTEPRVSPRNRTWRGPVPPPPLVSRYPIR